MEAASLAGEVLRLALLLLLDCVVKERCIAFLHYFSLVPNARCQAGKTDIALAVIRLLSFGVVNTVFIEFVLLRGLERSE